MLGLFIYLSRFGTKCINFDEFLAEEINSQLANFCQVCHFRYQVYLYAFIISSNKQFLEEMESKLFKQWPSTFQMSQNLSCTQFIDRVILSISRLFDPKVSRISEDMKSLLQQESVGDWFLRKDNSLIRVYGFTASPLILPVFLTSTVFSLELMRQRLGAYIEHFISHKKSSQIKYPINIGPFILKKEATFPIIEEVLKQFKFRKEIPLNYDPKSIISDRRVTVDRSTFQHSDVPNLSKEANSLEYDFNWSIVETTVIAQAKPSTNPVDPLLTKNQPIKKRSISDVSEMDFDQQVDSKKLKVDTEKDTIDLEKDEEQNQETKLAITFVEEETTQQIVVSKLEEKKKKNEEITLQYKNYAYATTSEGQFKRKSELFSSYMDLRKHSLTETQKKILV